MSTITVAPVVTRISRAEECRTLVDSIVRSTSFCDSLRSDGYLPPDPPPLVVIGWLKQRAWALREYRDTIEWPEEIVSLSSCLQEALTYAYPGAMKFYRAIESNVSSGGSLLDRLRTFLGRIDRSAREAEIDVSAPYGNDALRKRMQQFETFCSTSWSTSNHRSTLSVHVDDEQKRTIVQIGIAEYGPVYIQIPKILRPEQMAHATLKSLMGWMKGFGDLCDPLAVLNGDYPTLNFNYAFPRTRVIRAPSGDTEQLRRNLAETRTREQLRPDNTTIINSAPGNVDAYRRVFKNDERAVRWPSWIGEAELWDEGVRRSAFTRAAMASREAFIEALAKSKNVIVIIAHCDGEEICLPDPEPLGTSVTLDYIREHRDAISNNRPFVYLFACEAARLNSLENFASVLLASGASGVVASQTPLGGAEGRALLERIVGEERTPPPIEDVWRAMNETGIRDMEVFLA